MRQFQFALIEAQMLPRHAREGGHPRQPGCCPVFVDTRLRGCDGFVFAASPENNN
jgi:hypothetical protein